ncbi:MAG: response regulator [bacterium]
MARILVVDDQEGPLEGICNTLVLDLEHDATGVLTTDQVLTMVGDGYDLIISERDMPCGGAEWLLAANLGIPIIVMSGGFIFPDSGARRQILLEGAVATISKLDPAIEIPAAVATVLACQIPLEPGMRVMANCPTCAGIQFMVKLGREEALVPGFGSGRGIGRMRWTADATGTSFDLNRTDPASRRCKCFFCATCFAHVVAICDPVHGPQIFLYESEGA